IAHRGLQLLGYVPQLADRLVDERPGVRQPRARGTGDERTERLELHVRRRETLADAFVQGASGLPELLVAAAEVAREEAAKLLAALAQCGHAPRALDRGAAHEREHSGRIERARVECAGRGVEEDEDGGDTRAEREGGEALRRHRAQHAADLRL